MTRIAERVRAGKAVFVVAAAALLLGACVAPVADGYWYDDGYSYRYGHQYGYPQSYRYDRGDGYVLGYRRDNRQRRGYRAFQRPRRRHLESRADHAERNRLSHGHGPGLGQHAPDRARPAGVKRRVARTSVDRKAIREAHLVAPRRADRAVQRPRRRPLGHFSGPAERPDLRHGDGPVRGELVPDRARRTSAKRRVARTSANRKAIREARVESQPPQRRPHRPAAATVDLRTRPHHAPRETTEGAKKAKKHARAPTIVPPYPAQPAPRRAHRAGRASRRDLEH